MTPTVKTNFKNKKEFIQLKWTCEGCAQESPNGEIVGNLDNQSIFRIEQKRILAMTKT